MALTLAASFAVLSASTSLLVTAAPSLLAERQASTADCTSSSFTIPSWFVNDFQTGPGASFSILNRATGSSFSVACQAAGSGSDLKCSTSGSASDPSLQISLQVKDKLASIKVQQSWPCSDRNPSRPAVAEAKTDTRGPKRLAFTASGNTAIPLSCASGGACKSSNPIDLVKGSLSSPVQVTPAYAEGPAGHNKPGCVAGSQEPEWTLGTIIFLNETGDGADAIQSQSIQLQVTNEATGYVAGCLMYFNNGEDTTPIKMTCGGGADFVRRNRYSIRTETVFYPRSWTFTINETWFCDDVDAAKPVSYTAAGKTTLPLACTTENGRTACQADGVRVSGKVDSQTELAPYSIEDPLPTADGCTISSIVSPSWTLSNFEVDKSGSGGASAIAFNMKLNTKVNLFDYPVFVTHSNVRLDSTDAWYPCVFGPNEAPLAPRNCTFQYREKTNTLAINADWTCIDLDADHPLVFNGIATAKLPELDCEKSASSGLIQCRTQDGYGWVAEVSDATWRTESVA
ncbi:hypothetical protein B0H67DRAFT_478554 [Lasiosphaeris hirsuta]|uniref:Uncharacterized protein n=1 Tax=Lasiosphaeris hirsuta TaxID=260670 RepID=A0AA40BDE0_9PEZI|nr:hypothetical protein B0H67DRAFT_478554 [Lasiosphaeris hirsuta]